MDVRIHRWGASRYIDQSLMSDGAVDTFAYVRKDRESDVIRLVELPVSRHPERALVHVLNHETLHVVLHRMQMFYESNRLDRISNVEDWVTHGSVGGL